MIWDWWSSRIVVINEYGRESFVINFCYSNIHCYILHLWFSQHHFLIFIFIIYSIDIKRIINIINRQFDRYYITSFVLLIRCGLFRRIYQTNQLNNYECCFDSFHCSLQSLYYILIIQYNSKKKLSTKFSIFWIIIIRCMRWNKHKCLITCKSFYFTFNNF